MYKLDLSDVSTRNFANILKQQAEHNGETVFLKTDQQSISFAQAEELTNRLAAGLKTAGVSEGDRVALYMGNRPEMVLLALAVNKLRAVWVPISTDYKGEWLADTIERSRCCVLATDAENQQKVAAVKARLAGSHVLLVDNVATEFEAPLFYSELLAAKPLQPVYDAMFYGDTCAILWTSGTTGKSKGVMQSYNAWIVAIQEGASRFYNSVDGDIMYCVLPLYNSGAWITSILRALLEGITVVIEPKFSVHAFWDRIRHFGATQTFAIGAMGVFLLNSPAREDDADNPLRVAQIVPMPADRWQEFEQRFGVELLRSGLGQSECLSVTRQLGSPENIPPHSIGFANPALEVALLSDTGEQVADGETGELAVKPKQPYLIFNGYFDDEEATRNAYHGDWYRTGDLARKDPATGAYYFADRKKDAIRYGGRNISTLEVESVAIRHPAVKEVAAYGITCAEVDSEQELKLSVVVEPGQDFEFEQLCAFINANAPYYFVPRFIQVVESLPYTPTNKLQKFKLREAGNDDNTWDLKRSNYRVER